MGGGSASGMAQIIVSDGKWIPLVFQPYFGWTVVSNPPQWQLFEMEDEKCCGLSALQAKHIGI